MIKQYLKVENSNWKILFYYLTTINDAGDVMDKLLSMGCPLSPAKKATQIVCSRKNTGLTFSDMNKQLIFVCISDSTDKSQFVNTVMHEIHHINTALCVYYGIKETDEQAAYLTGYIAQKVYQKLERYMYG